MSRLEQDVKPTLTRMITAERAIHLTPADQDVLVRWAFKTGILADFLTATPRLTPSVYRDFYRDQWPPWNCFVWAGVYVADRIAVGLLCRTQTFKISAAVPPALEPSLHDVGGWLVTFNLGRVVFQAFVYNGRYRYEPIPTGSGRLDNFLVRLWPAARPQVPLLWPPRGQVLDGEMLGALANRNTI